MNSLIDDEIIGALYEASRSGVQHPVERARHLRAAAGHCRASATTSRWFPIVDRFLEHSRVYYFLNGGDEQVYLASADWMSRNLDKRIELMFPIEHPGHKASVSDALRAMFRDKVKARWLGADGVYVKRTAPEDEAFRVQTHLQEEAERRASLARESAGVIFRPERPNPAQ